MLADVLPDSFIICGFLEIQNIAFSVFPMIHLGGQLNFLMTFAQNWISIANSTVNPVVYFAFNQGIRQRALTLFGIAEV
ncbi:hypothetical protein L596_030742 [Steinernema carpocapsae]|uniref:G-protein coupled receptors family 1 profile domain-containing protein n=1 Tax=Steinernema carpocapsae TaxID=34508 RepID=A0A4U5LNM2_STECR|nr:hypothetical protein L596_030742 [Steinernema carpocapsae]